MITSLLMPFIGYVKKNFHRQPDFDLILQDLAVDILLKGWTGKPEDDSSILEAIILILQTVR